LDRLAEDQQARVSWRSRDDRYVGQLRFDRVPCPWVFRAAYGTGSGQPSNFSGTYVGVNGSFIFGQSRYNFPDGMSGNFPITGVGLGLDAGVNWQNGPYVYGIVATINAATTAGSTILACAANCAVSNPWLATADARIGYTISPDLLLFIDFGGAFANLEQKIGNVSSNTTRAGGNVGGGLEYKLDGHWSAKAEYMFVDLGKVPCADTVCGPNANTPVRENIITFGVNYSWSFPGENLRSSDARLKRDIVTLGHLENGLAVYRFRYAGSEQVYVGVMAQEVQLVRPDAVVRGEDGFLLVDYDRLGLRMETWDEWVAEQNMPRSNVNP
jgi:opacity protein-like surface antigen